MQCPRKIHKRGWRGGIEGHLRKQLYHKEQVIVEKGKIIDKKNKIIAQLEWQLAVARAAAGHQ